MPTENLSQFIQFIIPGFIALGIFKSFYPEKDRDIFFEITNSLIVGIIILAIVKWIDRNYLNYFLYSNFTGLPGIRFSITLILSGVLAGYLFVGITETRSLLAKRFSWCNWMSPNEKTVWLKVNSKSSQSWAIVYLDDKEEIIYRGWISDYTIDPEENYQDFLLSNASRVDKNLKEIHKINGLGVYLNLKDIKRIVFLDGNKKTPL